MRPFSKKPAIVFVHPNAASSALRLYTYLPPPGASRPAAYIDLQYKLDTRYCAVPEGVVASANRIHPDQQAHSRPPALDARQDNIDSRRKCVGEAGTAQKIYRIAPLLESGILLPFWL